MLLFLYAMKLYEAITHLENRWIRQDLVWISIIAY